MSALTNMLPTRASRVVVTKQVREKGVPWREVFASEIAKYTEVGAALRGARFKEDMTQKEVAEKLGILPHHISEMEHGKRPIGKAMAKRLAKLFHVDYRVFL